MSSRQLEEVQEEAANKQLADNLGISYDELCELQWTTDTNESNDGLICEYVITFDESSPIEIIKKIDGINLEGKYVCLSPWEFDSEDDYYEEGIEWDINSSE